MTEVEVAFQTLKNGLTDRRREVKLSKILASIAGGYLLFCFVAPATLSADTIPELARDILSWGPKVVLLTRGGEGTDIYTPGGVESVPAFRGETEVVDTTGAGDCYTAGFFFRYARTQDLAAAVRFGSMAAYHVIQQRGGVVTRRMPTSAQVEEALRGWRK